MDAAGVPVDPALIRHGNFYVDAAVREARAMLDLDPATRPTAIFALNDLQALGVYQAARDLRLHIPDDLSVVGFDDIPTARWATPAPDDSPAAARSDGRHRGAGCCCASPPASSRARRASSSRPSSSSAPAHPRRPVLT